MKMLVDLGSRFSGLVVRLKSDVGHGWMGKSMPAQRKMQGVGRFHKWTGTIQTGGASHRSGVVAPCMRAPTASCWRRPHGTPGPRISLCAVSKPVSFCF